MYGMYRQGAVFKCTACIDRELRKQEAQRATNRAPEYNVPPF